MTGRGWDGGGAVTEEGLGWGRGCDGGGAGMGEGL